MSKASGGFPLKECMCTCGGRWCASRRGMLARRGYAGIDYHGTKRAYAVGCRCAECLKAHSVETTKRRHKLNTLSLDAATRRGYDWTDAELRMALDYSRTAREVAPLIGRTMYAVKNVRTLVRRGIMRPPVAPVEGSVA